MKSSFFTVAHSYVRTLKSDHCSGSATFVSEILLAEKLTSCSERVKLKLKEVKKV